VNVRRCCAKCDQENRLEAIFCGACGERITVSSVFAVGSKFADRVVVGASVDQNERARRYDGTVSGVPTSLLEFVSIGHPEDFAQMLRSISEMSLPTSIDVPTEVFVAQNSVVAVLPPRRARLASDGPFRYLFPTSLGTKVSVETVIRWATPLAGALDEFHQRGAVHGGIAPETIVQSSDEALQLVFDDAPAVLPTSAFLEYSKHTHFVGLVRPGYSPPEAYAARSITAKTDLYSFAAVLARLLTGEDPKESVQAIGGSAIDDRFRAEPWFEPLDRALNPVVDRRAPSALSIINDLRQAPKNGLTSGLPAEAMIRSTPSNFPPSGRTKTQQVSEWDAQLVAQAQAGQTTPVHRPTPAAEVPPRPSGPPLQLPGIVGASVQHGYAQPVRTPTNGFSIAGGIVLLLGGLLSLAGWIEFIKNVIDGWEFMKNVPNMGLSIGLLVLGVVLSVTFGVVALAARRRPSGSFLVAVSLFIGRLGGTLAKGETSGVAALTLPHQWSMRNWQPASVGGGLVLTGVAALLLLIAVSSHQGDR
jgi:hypothetical protein